MTGPVVEPEDWEATRAHLEDLANYPDHNTPEEETPTVTTTIVITADEVAPGMVLNYPVWRDRRPAGAAGNVNPEALRVKAIDDSWPENRVLWFDDGTHTVVGRTARLVLVVPEADEDLVDTLAELEIAIAESAELERAAMRLAQVRGTIIARAHLTP